MPRVFEKHLVGGCVILVKTSGDSLEVLFDFFHPQDSGMANETRSSYSLIRFSSGHGQKILFFFLIVPTCKGKIQIASIKILLEYNPMQVKEKKEGKRIVAVGPKITAFRIRSHT